MLYLTDVYLNSSFILTRFLFCHYTIDNKGLLAGDVIVVVLAAGLCEAVEEVEDKVRRCRLKILMLIWKSIIKRLCS